MDPQTIPEVLAWLEQERGHEDSPHSESYRAGLDKAYRLLAHAVRCEQRDQIPKETQP